MKTAQRTAVSSVVGSAGGLSEIQVWSARLDLPDRSIQSLWFTLSAEEQARALRFHFRIDHNRFVAAHGVLRAILGHRLGVEPRALRFRYGPNGKPELADQFAGQGIRFSLSHSQNLALYAITSGSQIGVDVEYVRTDFEYQDIARHFFSSSEVAGLQALPPSQRTEAFFRCWTRKEAYLKASGAGLSVPLDEVEVSVGSAEPPRLLNAPGGLHETSRWSLLDLTPSHGYVAAIAIEGFPLRPTTKTVCRNIDQLKLRLPRSRPSDGRIVARQQDNAQQASYQ